MKNLGLEFKVGLFTLMGLAATGYLFFALSPDAFDTKEVKTYYTHLENASGIVPKSHVKTSGVSVGKVLSVELGASNTTVHFEIRGDIKIPKGSTLAIKSVGFLGDSHIEILRAEDSGNYIDSDGFIPESSDSTDLNKLIEIGGNIAKDIKKITANLSDALGSEEGRIKIHNIVDNIEAITENARGILEDNRPDIRKFVSNLSEVLNDENKEKLDRIIAAFDESMEEVKSATKNINLISARVEKGEGTIGRLINDDEALEELEGAIKDIREVLSPATKLEIAVDAKLEARRHDSQAYFNMVFKTRPDRYYLIGLTSVDAAVEEETIEDTSEHIDPDDETDTQSRRTIKRREQFRFNLQFAKRWHFVALRFGLFETTGGVASDFYILNDRIRISLEAFDWKTVENNERRVAHLKAYASVLFFNHLYLMAGIDDPTKYEKRYEPEKLQKPNYFFGAGITFNDQDLKALFGAAALTSL